MRRLLLGLLASSTLVPAAAFAQAAPSDFTSATRYDGAQRITGTIAPDPDGAGPLHHLAVRNSYDAAGRLIRVEKGELAAWMSEDIKPADWSLYTTFTISQQIDTAYDSMDRKVREDVSSGGVTYQVTQYSYDTAGRLECTAVRMNPAAFGSLPASACTQGTPGAQGADRITRSIYDAAGQLLQVRKAVGTGLEQAYVTYSYTPNGKQEYVVDANGNKARLVYDGLDRQAQWQFPSASAPGGYDGSTPANALATSGAVNANDREEYGYDANGNRTSLRKRDGRTFTFAFDNLNRMASKTVPTACVSGYACTNVPASMARSVYYAYDLRGLQTAARFDSASGADAVTQVYDGFGRITSSTTSMGGVSRTLGYQYDAEGNRTQVMHPDGNYAGYHYDGLNRLDTAGVNTTSGLLARIYDTAGRLNMNGSGSWTYYAYDGVGRLIGQNEALTGSGAGSVNTALGYNPANQITSRSRNNDAYGFTGYANANRAYTVNGLNQYGSAGGVGFGYDSNGNLTASGGTAYTYDAENRLVVASNGVQLTWDPLGRLYETYSPTTGTTRFLYSGDELVAEYDGAGTMLRRYIHGPGEDDPLAWFEGPSLGGSWSNARLPKADHQGSIVVWTDWNGALSQINSYDEYGIPAATNIGRFQYTGQAWIPELGMYHYKARIYSPTLGRFLQTDPVGYKDQVNLYAYVGNDPMNKADPRGTDAIVVINKDNSVEITLPMTFSGDAATPSNISAAISNIQSAWTGQFDGIKVTTTVVVGTSPLDSSVKNTMEIRSGPTDSVRSNGIAGHSYVRGGNTGQVTMRDVNGQGISQSGGRVSTGDKGGNTYAHEGGHYMGAPDTGPGTGLMGHGNGSTPTGADIREIMKKNPAAGGLNTIIDKRKDQ